LNATVPASDIIATEPAPHCYLCGANGVMLYEGLTDQWFGASGSWNLKRCPKPECGLVWLDPMPSKEDVWKAYKRYFTHEDYSSNNSLRHINILDLLAAKFCRLFYKIFMRISSWRSREKVWREKGDTMFLGSGIPERNHLLDVGCGKGDFMTRMHRQGWQVEGLEVDADAVKYARSISGLSVHLGSLENIRFPDNTFDVITSNHVIEHVHDPIALIRECLRILKPGGRLVLATPNMESFGHQIFERNWSHLDPPRHLQLFTMKTLRECAVRAGFQSINVWCPPGYAEGAFPASIERKDKISGKERSEAFKCMEASSLKIRAYYRYFVKKEEKVGEEIFLMATKSTQ